MRSIKALLSFAAVAGLLIAGDKKKPEAPETVISGSVFRDPGYALPEATVSLMRKDDPKHKKLAQVETTYRGEFSFHVPVPSQEVIYVVKASAKGFRAEEKEAPVTGPDRIDLTFTLEPETKK